MKANLVLLILICIGIIACTPSSEEQNQPQDDSNYELIKEYYYPIDSLYEGRVYEYSNIANNEAYISHYWHLQSQQAEDGNTYLIWKRYNPLFQQDMYIKEWIVNDGVITQEYLIYTIDSATQERQVHENKISQNVVFPFKASKDSVMAYRFECEVKLPPDYLTVKLVRDRKFKQLTTFEYKGEEIDAALFANNDLYDIENKEEGGFWKQQKGVVEIYGKNIGLVYQEEKTAGQEGTEVIRLTNIYSLEEFEALARDKK